MKITKIQVKRFKAIEDAEIIPEPINIIIGENNAGKSSFLQAIQFAVSIIQVLSSRSKRFKFDEYSSTLSFAELNYTPAKLTTTLCYGKDDLRADKKKQIEIIFFADNNGKEIECHVQVRRGKNSNLSVTVCGEVLFNYIANAHKNFSMYVPGLAGVPFDESYQAPGAVRRAAARGDANTVLRNVLYELRESPEKWGPFIADINLFFPDTQIQVNGHLEENGIIEVQVTHQGIKKSIETIGTGILQTIQICAYIHLFEPDILLLDEPDSHLHPVNQRLLGGLIANVAKEDRVILIATHSRHLLSSLRNDSKVIVFKNGDEAEYTSEYQILFDIGALDQYDVYRDPKVKYVYMIEDTSELSKRAHENVLIASGFDLDTIVFLPYNSSSKIDSAIFTAESLLQFRPDLHVIIHSDRDGRKDEAIKELEQKFKRNKKISLFVTEKNDIEMYYCNIEHIKYIADNDGIVISSEELAQLFRESLNNVDEKCCKSYLNRVVDPLREKKGEAAYDAQKYYEQNRDKCMNGHILAGELIQQLHKKFHLTRNDFFGLSPALADSSLAEMAQKTTK